MTKQKGFYIVDDIKKGFNNVVEGTKKFHEGVKDGAKKIDDKFFSSKK